MNAPEDPIEQEKKWEKRMFTRLEMILIPVCVFLIVFVVRLLVLAHHRAAVDRVIGM